MKDQERNGKKKQRSSIIFVAFFVFIILGNVIADIGITQYHNNIQSSYIKMQLHEDILNIQTELDRKFALLNGLEALVVVNNSIEFLDENFELFASALCNTTTGIRNFIIAPNGINTFVYPLEGNDEAVDHNILNDSRETVQEDIARMFETNSTIISGPYELRQGGLGIIVRNPIYFDSEFWGLVSMVVDLDPIIENARIVEEDDKILYAIRNNKNVTFFGNPEYFNQTSITIKLDLIDGFWELIGIPTPKYNRDIFWNIFGVSFAVGIASLLIIEILFISTILTREKEKKVFLGATQYQIKKKQDYFMNLLSAFADGVCIVNKDNDIQYVNHVLVEDFGDWEGKKCYSYFHNRTSKCPNCRNQRVFAGKTVQWEWYSAINDKTYDLLDTLLINSDGTKSKLEVFRDITERKKTEQSLKIKEHAIESSSNPIILATLNQILLYVNPAWLKMWGYELPEEVLGQSLRNFIQDENENDFIKRFNAMKEIGSHFSQIMGKKKDGTTFHAYLTASTVYDDKKKPIQRMASFINISDRIKAEKLQKEFNQKLEEEVGIKTLKLSQEINDRKSVEDELRSVQIIMQYQIKQLHCLYSISQILSQKDASIKEILKRTLILIPPTFKFPTLIHIRIKYDGEDYRSIIFKETNWKLSILKYIGSMC